MKINMKSEHLLGKFDEKLTDVATKLLSLVSSSASMERGSSTMGFQDKAFILRAIPERFWILELDSAMKYFFWTFSMFQYEKVF